MPTSGETNYNGWTKTSLIQRVQELEAELQTRQPGTDAPATAPNEPRPASGKRKMDPGKYSTRYTALKLAYLGKRYGGFEFQAMGNQPSIEEELWKALVKSCLIFPDDDRVVQFDCCDYSKCGRTDRGVSAFGQVVALRLRSNRPVSERKRAKRHEDAAAATGARADDMDEERGGAAEKAFDHVKDELCYPRMLNRLLPKDIRVLAWCPSPPADFSARFSCRERQYRYFFTQPAFAPGSSWLEAPSRGEAGGGVRPGWLDIAAMRAAAKRFEGEHDFRNFCKIDPGKQRTNFRRRVFEADIVQVDGVDSALPYLQHAGLVAPGIDGGPHPNVFYFHVRGSAFLWHQIRHMVAILFLIGQGLEAPSLVSELLDVGKNPGRPSYAMADEVPLVLWDCIFPNDEGQQSRETTAPKDALEWRHVGEGHATNKFGYFDLVDDMWQLWRGCKMDELLAKQLLQQVAQQQARGASGDAPGPTTINKANANVKLFEGGNSGRLSGRYVPVTKKDLMKSPEEQNESYARRKGYESAEDMRAHKGIGWRRHDETMSDE